MSSTVRSGNPRLRVAVGVVAGILVAIILNTVVAVAAIGLDPGGTRTGLVPVAYGPMTALGVLAGTGGWALVRRFAARPREVLRALIPGVVLVSFVPGIFQLVAGTSAVNVIGLWVMHLVVAFVTVTVASRVLPVPNQSG